MFEATTLVRIAPWLTSGIFLWTVASGLLGDVHLPNLHRDEQPVGLSSSAPDFEHLPLQAATSRDLNTNSNPLADHLPHGGRLLQLMPNITGSLSNSSLSNTSLTTSSAQSNSTHTLSDTAAASSTRNSGLPQIPTHLQTDEQHDDVANSAHISSDAGVFTGNVHDRSLIVSSDDEVPASFASTLPHHTYIYKTHDSHLPPASNSASLFHNSTANVSNNHTMHPGSVRSDSIVSSAQPISISNFKTCPPHLDLPIPGLDIAPANQSKCYPHPAEYTNKNFLNDSYYMLYHHDMPTTELHPAFTWGDISRFNHVMHKMKRNDPVKAVFVGGSVSSSYCRNPSVTCWVKPVSDWLQHQNPNVKIINNAVGGTTSRTTAECFDAMVSKDADLIFLEYSYNDRFGIDPHWQQQGYEMLVRKLLKLPHKPAVLIVHWWGPKHDCLELLSRAEAAARSEKHADHQCAMTLWNSTEDRIQTIVQHYGVQSISFRNAFWAEIDAEVDGYLPHQTLVADLIHPNKQGVELLGNLVIKFLCDAQVHMSRLGHGSHTSPSRLPSPLYVDASMDDQSNTCTRGDALQDMMLHTVDWYWVDGKKPGFQTDIPGASIVLMVTLPDGPVSKLSLGYLASYEGMGWAQVECLGACSCTVLKIDANSTARASQEHFANIDIERQNDGASCLLKVASLNQSSSIDNGHKFKVSSVAWSGEQTGSESTSAAAQHQHSSSASVQSTETVTQQNATQSPQPETVKSEPDDLQAEPDLMLGNM